LRIEFGDSMVNNNPLATIESVLQAAACEPAHVFGKRPTSLVLELSALGGEHESRN
jgi:hypothetical protein